MTVVDWLQSAGIVVLAAALFVQMKTIGVLMAQIDALEDNIATLANRWSGR